MDINQFIKQQIAQWIKEYQGRVDCDSQADFTACNEEIFARLAYNGHMVNLLRNLERYLNECEYFYPAVKSQIETLDQALINRWDMINSTNAVMRAVGETRLQVKHDLRVMLKGLLNSIDKKMGTLIAV